LKNSVKLSWQGCTIQWTKVREPGKSRPRRKRMSPLKGVLRSKKEKRVRFVRRGGG